MARSIAEMASKGAEKLRDKAANMKINWEAARSRMKSNYADVGFNSTLVSKYGRAIDAATYRAPDADLWRTRWTRAVS